MATETKAGAGRIAAAPCENYGEMQYFTKIGGNIDISPILAELAAVPQLWHADRSRQRKVRCQRNTLNIFLRTPRKPLPAGAKNANDVHESRVAPAARKLPSALKFCETIAERSGGELGRATLVSLLPGKKVFPHVDAGAYYRIRDRYHLVLKSSRGSPLTAEGETALMWPGELWAFDNKVTHSAENRSGEPRVHLIFDILPPPGQGLYVHPAI